MDYCIYCKHKDRQDKRNMQMAATRKTNGVICDHVKTL